MRSLVPGVIVVCVLAGCGSGSQVSEMDYRAERHIRLAETFELNHNWREAILEYQIVADQFVSSTYYPEAVKNLAILNINPLNPFHNDSTGLRWLYVYLGLAPSSADQEDTQLHLGLVSQLVALRADIDRMTSSLDSLQQVLHKQTGELTQRTRQMQDLEAECRQLQSDLDRLKAVDKEIRKREGI